MSDKITFGIPFHKNLAYLTLTLQSVKRQTSSEWVCIISDDGAEGAAVQSYVESLQDSRFVYSRAEGNLGIAGNWNRVFQLANTDLVTLLHADDELGADYAQAMLTVAELYRDAAAFFCGADIIDAEGKPRSSFVDQIKLFIRPSFKKHLKVVGDEGLASLLRGQYIMCPTVCYRKSQMEGYRFDPSWSQVLDLEFFARLLLTGRYFVGMKERHYRYRRHNDSQTAILTRSNRRFDEEIAIYDKISREAKNRGWKKSEKTAKAKRIIVLHLLFQACVQLINRRFEQVFMLLGSARKIIFGEIV